ncbi:MAG: MgtC/SapB family protein [Candidatus Altiarchaeota archaeon]
MTDLVLSVGENLLIIFNIILSALIGLLMGFERKRRGKTAGIRTFSLICLGACVFTMLSLSAFKTDDTARIAAQIVTGIGFLGAGVIWRGGEGEYTIHGITTAADMWVSAAIGMAIGTEQYVMAVATTVVVMIILNIHTKTEVMTKK